MKSIFYGKRGTEKPIEIFVALFVILAVALVMLKLFQNQITEQKNKLGKIEQERKQQELKETAVLYCKDKCTEASNDGCSLKSLASLCIAYGSNAIKSPDYLDFNNNGMKDLDTTQLAGIGVCEDAVPCFILTSDCCGRQLNGKECKLILTDYWTTQGIDVASMMTANIKKGACTATNGTSMWYTLAGFP